MHLMLTQDEPDDYIIGTGISHTVQELVDLAFEVVGLEWRRHVVTDTSFMRATDADFMCADPAKAFRRPGWKPAVTSEQMVEQLVESDLRLLTDNPDVQL